MILAPVTHTYMKNHPLVEFKSAIEDYKSSVVDYKSESHCPFIPYQGNIERAMPSRKLEKSDVVRLIKIFARLKEKNEISESTFNAISKAILSFYIEEVLSNKFREFNFNFCTSFYRAFNKSKLFNK